jgi:uncharacterized hydrophobic protein (TIGR00271 family)
MDAQKLARLSGQFERDARLDGVFVVLTLGATLIASLGLLANSTAVVIGAMVVAPWIMPLRAAAFAGLLGRWSLFGQACRTLASGVLITLSCALILGRLAGLASYGSEIVTRTAPNLLDLGVALVAGAVATYAKVRSEAVSSLAGTAIAVALVPPVCVVGLCLAAGEQRMAVGAALLFSTNLVGIISGALVLLALSAPELRRQLQRSRLGWSSLLLTLLLLVPLGGSFLDLARKAQQTAERQRISATLKTLLADNRDFLGTQAYLVELRFDWERQPPLVVAVLRVRTPGFPTPGQVAQAERLINSRQPQRLRLVVERSTTDLVLPR